MNSRDRPTPEVQNDGRQTGSSYISRSTTDRHSVPTAIPMFSGLPDSMDLSPTPADVDRHPKCKMATAKPDAVRSYDLQQTDTQFKRLYQGFQDHPTTKRHLSFVVCNIELNPSNFVSHVEFSCIMSGVGWHQKPGYNSWNLVHLSPRACISHAYS